MVLAFTKHRLANIEIEINKFIDRNIKEWAEEEILRYAKEDLIKAGQSQSVADAMRIIKTGFGKISLIWDYQKDGKPIAVFLEEGTEPHIIRPKSDDHLLSWKDKNGVRRFAKEVFHPGFEGRQYAHTAVNNYKPNLQRRVTEEVNDYIERTRIDR